MPAALKELSIAGISSRLKLQNCSGKLSEKIDSRYRKFLLKSSSRLYNIDLSLNSRVCCSGNIKFNYSAPLFKIRGRGMAADLYEGGVKGEILPDIHILDSLLRIIYSRLLIGKEGFLIHASAAEGELYTGPAGSGKTTSVRGKKNMLGDDIVGLRKKSFGWAIYSTPFTGEFEGEAENCSRRLENINMLRSFKQKLSPAEIYSGMLKNILYYGEPGEEFKKLLSYVFDIANKVPARGACRRNLLPAGAGLG